MLRLSLKLRLLYLDRYYSGKSLTDIITGKVSFIVLEQFVKTCIIIERLGDSVSESRQMCSAFGSCYIIYKTEHALVERIIMLHRNLNEHIILLTFKIEYLIIERSLAPVKVGNEFLDTSLIMKRPLFRFISSYIMKHYLQILCKKSSLTKSCFKCIKIKYRFLEYRIIRHERYSRSGIIFGT